MITGYAFVNADMVVVNAIGGELTSDVLAAFERDYAALYGAKFSVPVMEGVTVWVNGTYNQETGEFSPPSEPTPPPESTLEVVDQG